MMNDDWMPPFAKLDKLKRIDPESEIDKVLEALPYDHKALELGQAIYRCKSVDWEKRWRVARECLKYETPSLGVTALVTEQDFATLLDRRIEHFNQLQTKQIEAKPVQVETRPAKPHVADKRYRRI